LTPENSIGEISLASSGSWYKVVCSALIIVGKLGPYMSASNIPTLNPNFCNENAKLTATVDLPTPPLQLLTAIIFLTDVSP
jgi:hypothetical protein